MAFTFNWVPSVVYDILVPSYCPIPHSNNFRPSTPSTNLFFSPFYSIETIKAMRQELSELFCLLPNNMGGCPSLGPRLVPLPELSPLPPNLTRPIHSFLLPCIFDPSLSI